MGDPGLQKKMFSAPRASVWSKNKGGQAPGYRKKRIRQLETVKMGEERGKQMEGRERNESNFGM